MKCSSDGIALENALNSALRERGCDVAIMSLIDNCIEKTEGVCAPESFATNEVTR